MHLSEGVLHTPVLLAGVAFAVVGVAVGLRRLESERLPLTALFAAAFFVAGTILRYLRKNLNSKRLLEYVSNLSLTL